MIAFEEIKQDEENYKKLSEKIFSTNYTEGLQELLTAIKETESYFFSYNQDKSIFTPQQRLQISEKLLSRVNEIKKFIRQTDNNYSLDNDAYCEAMHPVFVLEGELLTEIKNLKVYVEIISEAIPHEPAEPAEPAEPEPEPATYKKKSTMLENIAFNKNLKDSFVEALESLDIIEIQDNKYCIKANSKEEAERYIISIFLIAESAGYISNFKKNINYQWKLIPDNFCYMVKNIIDDFKSENLRQTYNKNKTEGDFNCSELSYIEDNMDF